MLSHIHSINIILCMLQPFTNKHSIDASSSILSTQEDNRHTLPAYEIKTHQSLSICKKKRKTNNLRPIPQIFLILSLLFNICI